MTVERRPSVDAAGTHAVHTIRRHTTETHQAALSLIDELLAMTAAVTTPEPAMQRPARVTESQGSREVFDLT
jgi:hypothetical protein